MPSAAEPELSELVRAVGAGGSFPSFTAPEEDFPALVRRVTFTNEGADEVELEAVDGLAKLEPYGTTTAMLAAMGRTLEGWMHVYNFADDHTTPFFHLVSAPAENLGSPNFSTYGCFVAHVLPTFAAQKAQK